MNPSLLKWAAAVTLFAGFAAAPAEQETKPEQTSAQGTTPFKFSVGASMVLVPVVVTDKRGQHAPDLTAGDFQVREDGQVQKIAGFEEVTAEASTVQRLAVASNRFTNQFIA